MTITWRARLAALLTVATLSWGLAPTAVARAAGRRGVDAAPALSASDSGRVPRPTVSGPILPADGAAAIQAELSEMPSYGYVQDEYFYEGTARSFAPTGPLGSDGRWSVAPKDTAPYRTRMLVRRPSDPSKFNGTVIVEWLNVTAGFDTSPDWQFGRIEMMRKGFIWVGISAQYVGVQGVPGGMTNLDPVRYGSLSHPGDVYSYDIYSQAANAIRRPVGVAPLAGYDVDHLIADGESQSASRMTTYVNAIAPVARAYDAYLIHSRSAGAPSLQLADPGLTMPTPVFIRTDQRVPVFVLESETDVQRYAPARQPDSKWYREWEVAGTSHVDAYALGPIGAAVLGCLLPTNSGPHHFVYHTVVRDLWRWMRHPGQSPPTSPKITLDAENVVVRDQYGNALGGIRTPELDAPAATLSGYGNSPGLCSLFGTTTPFTPEQLTSIYTDRTGYLVQYLIAEAGALDTRFVLRDDAFSILDDALAVPFPS
ncbi:MAG: alpha/beta hydrolase domain-containing protein [Acidimicrobiia bacterium]